MPRENRKRGKKHKKEQSVHDEPEPEPEAAGPSWILPSTSQQQEVNAEAPFGYVDADVKAYFRTVDLQIRDWQDHATVVQEDTEIDPNEDRRLFLVAALKEMSDRERQLATDPDCSSILERMAYSMDDFTRRVFMDRLAGSYEPLIKHRFASHVCQTMFTVAIDTVSRESRGIFPPVPDSDDQGELRTVTRLVLDACEEILPFLSSLLMDQFASHVIRAILRLLSSHLFPSESSSSSIRSKRSAAWKSHQGSMRSMFAVDTKDTDVKSIPVPEFTKMARRFVMTVGKELGDNEVRALAANQVASPVLQMLLEVEADQNMADVSCSLMDRVLVGLITQQKSDSLIVHEPSDYLTTLLRDPTSSHLLETLVGKASQPVFDVLWSTYFQGKLSRLALHPVANFVVAKAITRINEIQLQALCAELGHNWQKIIKSARVGVVRAVIEKAAVLHTQEEEVVEFICSAFELDTEDDKLLLVPCALRLASLTEYKAGASINKTDIDEQDHKSRGRSKRHGVKSEDSMEPKTQGALLLQSLLHLSAPHHEFVLQSVHSMPIQQLLETAYHPTSSRVLDAIFDSPTVNIKAKHKLIMSFIGEFHHLVDNKIGSRVGDRCMLVADPYLKEKIARSLLPSEHELAGSQYGKYFARNLNLVLFKRDLQAWKRMQASKASSQAEVPQRISPSVTSLPQQNIQKTSKRKREQKAEDDIDILFESVSDKKVKRLARHELEHPQELTPGKCDGDPGLSVVLGAIRGASKDEKSRRKRKH